MKAQSVKEIVSAFLGFLKYKVDNDSMTMEDVKALAGAIMNGLGVRGTIADLAGFYGKSPDSVRHVTCYKMKDKPRRRVTYSFPEFDSVRPASWTNESQNSNNQDNK